MKQYVLLFLGIFSLTYTMEEGQIPEPKPTEVITPERLKEQEDREREMKSRLRQAMQIVPLFYPHACRPKHLYFPDLKEEEQ